MDIKQVLIRNYLPYAKGTIVSRAIPAIDGFKPANRRILYTMHNMGLVKGDKKKSAKIVGQVMTYHPHGDATIYDTMVRMATGNESLNVPYVESKGNFGKTWSKNMAYAASRYTEAKLSPICAEVFEGLNENAVDMVPNFDNTEMEPSLLPVKFPSILVNTSNGIAVGCSSNIAPFGLTEVCNATIGMLDGSIAEDDMEAFMDVIGAPEFPTGGFIHTDRRELYKLCKTGRGTFTISGSVQIEKDRILIKQIPYKTDVESIVEEIKNHMKDELKDVVSVKDLSDIKGLNVQIMLKRGVRPRQVLKKINRLTKLRMPVSFSNTVIINNRCKTLGVYDLLKEWIAFRLNTVQRIYEFKREKKEKQVHLLETWEKLRDDIKGAVDIIANNSEQVAREKLMSTFGLDELQCDYILDMKIRLITTDRLADKIRELIGSREELKTYTLLATEEEQRKRLIQYELKEIIRKYGNKRKCAMVAPLEPEEEQAEPEVIDDSYVQVVITQKGCIKKIRTLKDMSAFQLDNADPQLCRISCRNTEDLLIYTYSGMCYKIKVNDIDDTRGIPKEYVFSMVEKADDSPIMYVTGSGDYTGSFNVVYPNGKGTKVYFSNVSGKRSKYKNQFEASAPGQCWFTTDDKFFIITHNKNAAYTDLSLMHISNRVSFKVARIGGHDSIFGVQPASRVPEFESIDTSKYNKGYCVKIKDKLW